jgi:hypothetical protein
MLEPQISNSRARRATAADLLPRFENPIENLLFGKGGLRRRLCDAYSDQLRPLRPLDFPSNDCVVLEVQLSGL